jgi:ankyrin repeat protein
MKVYQDMWARKHLLSPQRQLHVGLRRYLNRHKEESLKDIETAIARGANVNLISNFSIKKITTGQTKQLTIYREEVFSCTPLVFAIESTPPDTICDLVDILLKAGADVNNRESYDSQSSRNSALMALFNNTTFSMNIKMALLNLLLKQELLIQSVDELAKVTAFLSELIRNHHINAYPFCKKLMNAGMNQDDNLVNDLLHEAIIANYQIIVSYLLKQKPVNQWGMGTHDYQDKNRVFSATYTPLINAVLAGNLDIIQLLLKKGISVNKRSADNKLPMEEAILQSKLSVINLLLPHTDLAQFTSTGDTLLILALKKKEKDNALIHALLKAGANPQQTNDANETALHHAARLGNEDIMPALLQEASPDYVNHVNKHGNTALLIAAQHNHNNIVEYLLNAGAEDISNKKGKTAEHVARDYPTKKALITLRQEKEAHVFFRAIQLCQSQKNAVTTSYDDTEKNTSVGTLLQTMPPLIKTVTSAATQKKQSMDEMILYFGKLVEMTRVKKSDTKKEEPILNSNKKPI